MLEKNLLSEEEAREHPDASVITRAFGREPDLDLEVAAPFELREGDLLLLSSDGLCGYVDDERIRAALLAGGDAQETADRLIGLALDAGGQDNVSVQVITLPAATPLPAAGHPAAAPVGGRRSLTWVAVAVLLVVAFLAGLLLPWGRWIDAGIDWWHTEAPKESGDTKKTDRKSRPPAPRPAPRPPQRRERKPPGQVTVHVLVQTAEAMDGRGTETL